jgi:cobalt-zinc-cadmium efflux system protein
VSTTHHALRKALFLSTFYFFAQLAGGYWTGSLALLADAGHMFIDILALSLSLWAVEVKQAHSHSKIEIKIAIINALSLLFVAFWIIYEAYERLQSPKEIKGLETIFIAFGGLLVNYFSAKFLEPHQHHSLNVRSAWLHVLSDMLGSIAVMASAACILLFQWNAADPIFSIVIAIFILISGLNLLREIKGAK